MKYHAFISYRHGGEGQQLAKRIYQSLRQKGYRVWFDEAELSPGVVWTKRINDALQNSAAVLFVMADGDVESGWFRTELDLALKGNKRIVPIVTSKDAFVDMPEEMRERQGIIIGGGAENIEPMFMKLMEEIEDSIGFWSKLRSYIVNDA